MRAFKLAGVWRWALLPVLVCPLAGCASHEDQVTHEFMFVPAMPPPPPDPVLSVPAGGAVAVPSTTVVNKAPLPPPALATPVAAPAPPLPPSKAATGNVNPGGADK